MLIHLPHSMATHLTDGPLLPAPLLRQSPHSPCKAKRWVSRCKSATPVQSKLWVVVLVFTYTSVHLYFKCNCDRHKWKPAFSVHCSCSLTFTSTRRHATHSSVSIVFCSQQPFIAVFIYMSLWSQHNIDNAIVCQWQNTQTGYSGTEWDCICFQTEAKAVKSENWFFCLKQNVYNFVIAWQQSSTLVDFLKKSSFFTQCAI